MLQPTQTNDNTNMENVIPSIFENVGFFNRTSMIVIMTDICCISLHDQCIAACYRPVIPASISICLPFTENNRLVSLVKANGFSRGAS